jgi:hypothetical protein
MTSEFAIIAQRLSHRVPPRMRTARRYEPRAKRRETWLERWTRYCHDAHMLARGQRPIAVADIRPWLFLAAALVCIVLTWCFKPMSEHDSRPTNRVQFEPDPSFPVPVAPVQPDKPVQPNKTEKRTAVDTDQKQPLHIVALDEIAALKAEGAVDEHRQETPAPAEKDPAESVPVARIDGRPDNPDTYIEDPQTGAWVTPNNIWQVRDGYHLPISGKEITGARQGLAMIGVEPVIELQWWTPQNVDVPQKHWKGKLAKLQFLTVLPFDRVHQAEEHIRVVQVRGNTADGRALVEAVALFYSRDWNPVTSAVKEKADWFPASAKSVKKGDTGRLPIYGADIAPVRRALALEEGQGPIREVEWWAPRLYRAIGHRLSKLRYEVIRNGTIQTQEIVFDYDRNQATYAELPLALFPEGDHKALRLDGQR